MTTAIAGKSGSGRSGTLKRKKYLLCTSYSVNRLTVPCLLSLPVVNWAMPMTMSMSKVCVDVEVNVIIHVNEYQHPCRRLSRHGEKSRWWLRH
jgi:hypothetical protein